MAIVNRTANDLGRIQETVTLGDTTTVYSSEINALKVKVNNGLATQNISVGCSASAVAGVDVNVNLYGAFISGGTKYLIASNIVTALTNASKVQAGIVNLKSYPFPYFYLGFLTDANETTNSVAWKISGEMGGSQQ